MNDETDAWEPDTYHRYRTYRRRPFDALLAGVSLETPSPHVVDLGCGSGELTRVMHESLDDARTVGVDSSRAMLAAAMDHAGPRLRFERTSIEAFLASSAPASYDLIFSNAALHWVEDHAALFASLTRVAAPGALLAIQVPYNDHHVSHTTIVDVARSEPFASRLGGFVRTTPVRRPEWYAHTLHRLGWPAPDVRLQVFPQVLDGRDDVLGWIRGTTLTPYLARLGEEDGARFVDEVRRRLEGALPDERPFFYPYSRILMWARRAHAGDSP